MFGFLRFSTTTTGNLLYDYWSALYVWEFGDHVLLLVNITASEQLSHILHVAGSHGDPVVVPGENRVITLPMCVSVEGRV